MTPKSLKCINHEKQDTFSCVLIWFSDKLYHFMASLALRPQKHASHPCVFLESGTAILVNTFLKQLNGKG